MSNKSHKEWPMPEYMAAWQTFRDHSDEDEATAKHLVNSSAWPVKKPLVICDLGCGDGRIIEKLLTNNLVKVSVDEVRLVDPDASLLAEAKRSVTKTGKAKRITTVKKCARDAWPKCADGADVVLAVHVAYLMPNGELNKILSARPKGVTLFVVLDSPDSVFTSLWSETAKDYHARVLKAHETIAKHLGNKSGNAKSLITAKIPKSILKQHHHADWILSILCYADMRKNVTPQLRKKVDGILEQHLDAKRQNIVCKSVCYEFAPL